MSQRDLRAQRRDEARQSANPRSESSTPTQPTQLPSPVTGPTAGPSLPFQTSASPEPPTESESIAAVERVLNMSEIDIAEMERQCNNSSPSPPTPPNNPATTTAAAPANSNYKMSIADVTKLFDAVSMLTGPGDCQMWNAHVHDSLDVI